MANYSNLKAAIADVIKTNGTKAITGQVLQDTLNSIVSVIGANYQFAGVATPATNPGTPDQNVFYIAMQGGTYTNFNATALPDGISLLMWNGSWSSQVISYNDGGVFDISVYKSTGGTLATFADLAAALGTNGANVPVAARKGGMSVRFVQSSVQSSDNKYVQYRYMSTSTATADFTYVANWQGVDDEPNAGSENLIKSGGVYNELNQWVETQRISVEQSGWHTNELTLPLSAGVPCKFKLKLTGFVQTSSYEIYLYDTNNNRINMWREFGGGSNITSGNEIIAFYTPSVDIKSIDFRYASSSGSAPVGNNISFKVYNPTSNFDVIRSEINDDFSVYTTDTTLITSQSGWHTPEITFLLNEGTHYRLKLQLTGFIQGSNYAIRFYDSSNNAMDVTTLFGSAMKILSGMLIVVDYTPLTDIKRVEFRYTTSSASAPEGNQISLVSEVVSRKYALEQEFKTLESETEVATHLSDVNGKLYYNGEPLAVENQLSAVVTDLPVSDGTGIQSGYAYIDITDRSVKVKA